MNIVNKFYNLISKHIIIDIKKGNCWKCCLPQKISGKICFYKKYFQLLHYVIFRLLGNYLVMTQFHSNLFCIGSLLQKVWLLFFVQKRRHLVCLSSLWMEDQWKLHFSGLSTCRHHKETLVRSFSCLLDSKAFLNFDH